MDQQIDFFQEDSLESQDTTENTLDVKSNINNHKFYCHQLDEEFDGLVTSDCGNNKYYICIGDYEEVHYQPRCLRSDLPDLPEYEEMRESGKGHVNNPRYCSDYSTQNLTDLPRLIRKHLPEKQFPKLLFIMERAHATPCESSDRQSSSQYSTLEQLMQFKISCETLGITFAIRSHNRNNESIFYYYQAKSTGGSKKTKDYQDAIADHKGMLRFPNDEGTIPNPPTYQITLFDTSHFDYIFEIDEIHEQKVLQRDRINDILNWMRAKFNNGYSEKCDILRMVQDKSSNTKLAIKAIDVDNSYYIFFNKILPDLVDFLNQEVCPPDINNWNHISDTSCIKLKNKSMFIGNIWFKQYTHKYSLEEFKKDFNLNSEKGMQELLTTCSIFISLFLRSPVENILDGYDPQDLRLHSYRGRPCSNNLRKFIIPQKDDTHRGGVARAKVMFDIWKGGKSIGNGGVDRCFKHFYDQEICDMVYNKTKKKEEKQRKHISIIKRDPDLGPKHQQIRSLFRKTQSMFTNFFLTQALKHCDESKLLPINDYDLHDPLSKMEVANIKQKYIS